VRQPFMCRNVPEFEFGNRDVCHRANHNTVFSRVLYELLRLVWSSCPRKHASRNQIAKWGAGAWRLPIVEVRPSGIVANCTTGEQPIRANKDVDAKY
jgi:hypothetical protein